MTKEKAIRDAAAALLEAINAGKAAGVVIAWPGHPDGLATLAVSETAKAAAPDEAKGPATGRVS